MDYTTAIVLAFIGFVSVAFILLYPVWRFLKREEKVSEQWTRDALSRPPEDASLSDNGKTPPTE